MQKLQHKTLMEFLQIVLCYNGTDGCFIITVNAFLLLSCKKKIV